MDRVNLRQQVKIRTNGHVDIKSERTETQCSLFVISLGQLIGNSDWKAVQLSTNVNSISPHPANGWVHSIFHRENKSLSWPKGKLKLTWSSHQTGLQRPWFSRGSRTWPFHGDPILGVGARNGFRGFLLALQPLLDGLGVGGQVGQLVKDVPLADNSVHQIGVPWE